MEKAVSKLEQTFCQVWENSVDGMRILDGDGIILMVNDAFCQLVRKKKEALVGNPFSIVYAEPDRDRLLKTYRKKFAQGSIERHFQRELKLWDGTKVSYELTNSYLGRDGGSRRVLSIVRDLTPRRQSEEAVRESEARYRGFFEEDFTGNYISTPDGQILMCNPAFAHIFGYQSVEEAVKDNAFSFFETREQRRDFLQLLKDRGRLEFFEHRLRRKDGRAIYVIEKAIGRFVEGKLVEMQGYIFDNTERKMLEQQVIQMQKMETIGTLAGGIAHDFNNILGIILGHATLLERVRDDPGQSEESLSSIQRATERGASLVHQILTFARKAEVKVGPIDINSIIKELARMLEETFPKATTLTLNLEKAVPSILADQVQFHQALLNLCINARDAMSGKGTLTIETALVSGKKLMMRFPEATTEHYVQVSVADTGVGMDEDTKRCIFEPFFTTKALGKGTGLGLSVVYGVVRAHNGFIDVQSAQGVGSTFHLFFPVRDDNRIQNNAKANGAGAKSRGTETILVIEDEEMLRKLLTATLRTDGYEVLSASNSEEAFRFYQDHKDRIALVLSDMGLPKQNGWDIFKVMRRENPKVRFLLTSGYLDVNHKSEVLQSGIKGFIQKPYRTHEVLKTIRQILDEVDEG